MKKITLDLTKLNGNAFDLLSAFKRQARLESWTPEEIEGVIKEAINGDYNHLLQTLITYTK